MQLLFYATHFIYKTTNLVNGKFYIGQRKISREGTNSYLGSGTLLKMSINKYGKKNFKRDIIEWCTEDKRNEREIYWISYYDSTNKEIGYNLTDGGEGCSGRKMLEDTKIKIVSKTTGKKRTEEQKKRLSNSLLGRKLSKEHIKNRIIAQTGLKRKGAASKYIGISYENNRKNAWRVSIRGIRIGHYYTEIEAVKAYNKKAIELFGVNA